MKLIQCKLGAVETTVGGHTYAFQRDKHGRAVARVEDLVHRSCFLSVEHYIEVEDEPRAELLPDVAPDAEPDVAPDAEPDVDPDAEPDAEPDAAAAPDAAAEPDSEGAPETGTEPTSEEAPASSSEADPQSAAPARRRGRRRG